ncbi:DUF4127 family protein [Georgenia subflava]|uniref:DUF4127 family protein n=1 Tax=Georgenia subflava TaxID=1622177 RepID=A0A6N7EH41_9MICO|nr:DUF4127 family protein [Georgenia subflava]MPV36473.1 DUF4127 family protein [Georgenia subflava]
MRIALLPPDERPNTAGYARTVGACCDVEVVLPPAEAMPRFREPADTGALADWLRAVAHEVDHVAVSLDLLVHGGLIPSRNTDDRVQDVLPRLDVLRELAVPVTAYQVVTRLPHYDNASRSRQEPGYWSTHGARIGRLSRLWDQHAAGEAGDAEVAAARAEVPDDVVADLVRRRLRNHVVNLAALELASDGVVNALLLTSDDTAPRGLPAADRRALATWIDRLCVDVLTYPGADEVPSVLVARVAAEARGVRPRVAVRCPAPGGLERIAPYEDRPVGAGLANQIRALGGVRVDEPDDADLVLVLHAPATEPGDWVMDPPAQDSAADSAAVVAEVGEHLALGRRVAVADVRYANGSDPTLLDALDDAGLLGRLVAYGGWNTAGNTIGTTLAAGVSPVLGTSEEAAAARREFLARKIVEDGHYLPVVRAAIQAEAAGAGLLDPPLAELPAVHRRITEDLDTWARGVRALSGYRVADARLPWGYTFTVDFDLERTG